MLACVLGGCTKGGGEFYTQDGDDTGGYETRVSEYHDARDESGNAGNNGSGAESSVGDTGGQAAGYVGQNVCFVHICGAVEEPGVYEMPPGSRIYEVIEAAGGFRENACEYAVNQAQLVTDGMQIYIPSADEAAAGAGGVSIPGAGSAGVQTGRGDIVNINSADKEQLMTLPGIGAARAEAILDYRREHGRFGSVEELLKVSGIGQSIYEKIKDRVRI